MNKSKLSKTEELAVKKLSQKPPKELARLSWNTRCVDDEQNKLILKAIPYGTYNIANHEYRKHYEALMIVTEYCGMLYWKSKSLYLSNELTEREFNGIFFGLKDVIKHFNLDSAKVSALTMGVDFRSQSESFCNDFRIFAFNEIVDSIDEWLSKPI